MGVRRPVPSSLSGSRWRTAAAAVVVVGFFGIALSSRWQDVTSRKWKLEPGYFALASILLAASYALVAVLWAVALRRAAGLPVARGARIWFLANLARYVPGNVWSFVGAVELAKREGVARRTTLATMALTQLLSVGVALLVGLPVLAAEWARLGRPALYGAVAVAVLAALALAFRRRLGALLRRRYPGVEAADLVPAPGTAVLLGAGYACYWAVTGLAFAALVRSVHPLDAGDIPLTVAAYAAAYAVGFLALVTPAGLGVREGVLAVALVPVMPAGAALLVALLSRLWMMAFELLGAGVTLAVERHLDRRRERVG